MPELKLDGETIRYRVRRSKRARRIFIRHKAGIGFELVIPSGWREVDGGEIFRANQAWTLRTLAKARLAAETAAAPRQYQDGVTLPYLGLPLVIRFFPVEAGCKATVSGAPHRFDARVPKACIDDQDAIRFVFQEHYRQLAKAYLPPRVAELAKWHGFNYGAVRIKNQKTRWGSCSAQGNLNFNLRLMMAPPDAIDYIIYHELCHLREMNHGPRFWKLVAQVCPDYSHWKRWFKENGAGLVF